MPVRTRRFRQNNPDGELSHSRLEALPVELKLIIYHHLPKSDLLILSHVSKSWRVMVLGDSRWERWFELLRDHDEWLGTGKDLRSFVNDTVSKRDIVTVCFDYRCSLCSTPTPNIHIPLLQRICQACLIPEMHSLVPLSPALAYYDLKSREADMLPLVIRGQTSFVSRMSVQRCALKKHGGSSSACEEYLAARHCRIRVAYEARASDYDGAVDKRARLLAEGKAVEASAVRLKNGKQIPKTRPAVPAALLMTNASESLPVSSGVTRAQYLTVGPEGSCIAGDMDICAPLRLQALRMVQCEICVIIEGICSGEEASDSVKYMLSTRLSLHEQFAHYAVRSDWCMGAPTGGGMCKSCVNAYAIEVKERTDGERMARLREESDTHDDVE